MEQLKASCIDCLRLRRFKPRMKEAILVWMVVDVLMSVRGMDGLPKEAPPASYCPNEVFKANCGRERVVVMTTAMYGRMSDKSRCIRKNYGYVGCGSSVIGIADHFCSGRRSCEIPIPNTLVEQAKSACPEDFKSYMDAGYRCIDVVSHHAAPCRSQQTVALTRSTGTIANVVTMETGCGAPRSPWLIEGRPGQRINLTLVDFSHGVPHVLNAKSYAYAIVREMERGRTSTVCQGTVRERHVYTTVSHRLQVVILGRTELVEQPMFLLKYAVYGCPDIQPTQGIWVKRVGDSVTCGCNNSNLRWKLRCQNDTWNGQKYNCSTTAMRRRNSRLTPPWFAFSYEIGVTIVIAIAVVVASLIFCIGMICLKRNMTEQRRRQPVCLRRLPDHELVAVEPGNGAVYGDTFVRKATDRGAYEMGRIGDNEYASIQDVSAGTYPEHAHGAVPTYTGCAPFQSYSSLEPPLEKAASAAADDATMVTSHPMFAGGNGHQYFVVEQDNTEIELVNCRN